MTQIQNCRVESRRGRREAIGESRFPHSVGVAATRLLVIPAFRERERTRLFDILVRVRDSYADLCKLVNWFTTRVRRAGSSSALDTSRGQLHQPVNRAISDVSDLRLRATRCWTAAQRRVGGRRCHRVRHGNTTRFPWNFPDRKSRSTVPLLASISLTIARERF